MLIKSYWPFFINWNISVNPSIYLIKFYKQLIFLFCIFHSTREIKPNQTDIGRKIKIKSGQTQPSFNRTTPNSLPATVKNNARLPSAPSSSLYSSGTPSYKGPLNSHKNTSNHNDDDDEERGGVGTRMDHDSHLNSQSSASSLIQSLMSLPTNYDDHDSSSSNLNHNPNHLSNRGSGGSNLHHRNPDIMKRSIK